MNTTSAELRDLRKLPELRESPTGTFPSVLRCVRDSLQESNLTREKPKIRIWETYDTYGVEGGPISSSPTRQWFVDFSSLRGHLLELRISDSFWNSWKFDGQVGLGQTWEVSRINCIYGQDQLFCGCLGQI